MKTILFLHGFYASGSCVPALALKKAFADTEVKVLTPDLPLHPEEAITLIRQLCDKEKPDLLVGNSCGSFYAQYLAPVLGIPALLGNPHFEMSKFLQERIGPQQYKSPRRDGKQDFIISKELIEEFKTIEKEQFHYTNPYYTDKVWGIFGEQDSLAHYQPLFLEYYNQAFHFPGGHTPTEEEVWKWYAPLIEKMLQNFHRPDDGIRYFQHFKGNRYKMLHIAYDSETQQRMVVYQAQYGEKLIWVRPEKMFFERITRNGRVMSRFTETDAEE